MNDVKFFVVPKNMNDFYHFKENGLFNTNGLTFDIDVITNEELIDEDQFHYLKTPFQDICQKHAWYYLNHLQNHDSRWVMKLNENSIYDVLESIKRLDHWFDWRTENYVAPKINYNSYFTDVNILKSMNIPWSHIRFEQNIFCLSQPAIKKLHNSQSKTYLEKRIQPQNAGKVDYSPRVTGTMCRLAKLNPVLSYHLTEDPALLGLTVFGGPFTNISFQEDAKDRKIKQEIILSRIKRTQKRMILYLKNQTKKTSKQIVLNENNILFSEEGFITGAAVYKDDELFLFFPAEKTAHRVKFENFKANISNKSGDLLEIIIDVEETNIDDFRTKQWNRLVL